MRHRLTGIAVCASLAIAAHASAGASWNITGARVDTTGLGNLANVTGGPDLTIGARLSAGWDNSYGAAQTVQAMSATNIAAVAALGLPLASNTLSYFGFYQGSLGYFGIAFKNDTGSAISFDANFSRTNQALKGVQVAGNSAANNGNYDGAGNLGNGTWSGLMTVAAGDTFYAVIGGFAGNFPMPLALSGVVDFGGVSRSVQYLSHDRFAPGTYDVAGSGSGFTSNMQFAVFNIPVPAPALLAAAGLVGAAAVRRRMSR